MIQAKRSFVKCGDWFTRISHFELCNRVSAPSVSLNNDKLCREFSEHKIAVCEKTAGLRGGNSSDLNSACLKVLVSVEIFQFSGMHCETERYRDSTDGPYLSTQVYLIREYDKLDDDSTNIYKSNIIERYSLRPREIPAVDRLCLAKFAALYYKGYKTDDFETKDSQPDVLNDELLESHNSIKDTEFPPKIELMNKNEYMKCRKVQAVIRYHRPNKTKQPELYFHHLLMLYLPWRNETELLSSDQTYTSKFYEPGVEVIVEENKASFEPDADAITEALESMRNNPGKNAHSFDCMNDQENSDLQDELPNDTDSNESFNEQQPSELNPTQSNELSTDTITYH